MIILGIDPGLTVTGWGVVAKSGSRLSHVANGQIRTDNKATMATPRACPSLSVDCGLTLTKTSSTAPLSGL